MLCLGRLIVAVLCALAACGLEVSATATDPTITSVNGVIQLEGADVVFMLNNTQTATQAAPVSMQNLSQTVATLQATLPAALASSATQAAQQLSSAVSSLTSMFTSQMSAMQASLSGEIAVERSRAAAAEALLNATLGLQLSNEISRAGTAEASIANVATQTQTSIATSLSSLRTSSDLAETSLALALAGTVVQLGGETSRATATETSLGAGLAQEISRAVVADVSLGAAVSVARAAVVSEFSRAVGVEGSISVALAQTSAAVSLEISRAVTTDASLAVNSGVLLNEVNTLASSLSSLNIYTYGQASNPGFSCWDIFNVNPTATASRVYFLNNGIGAVYCDMSTLFGSAGWTLSAILGDNATDTTWAYASTLWTSSTTTLNGNVTDPGSNTNMKNNAFNTLGFTQVRFVFGTPSATNQGFPVSTMGSNLASVFSAGTSIATAFSRASFDAALANTWGSIPAIVAQPNCNTNGVNLNLGGSYPVLCRFGMAFNNELGCASPDAWMCMGARIRGVAVTPQSGASGLLAPAVRYPMRGLIYTQSVAQSCLDLFNLYPSVRGVSGVYNVLGGSVYCDMSTNAGTAGWTLVAMLSDSSSDTTWSYYSPLWTTTATLNPTVTNISLNINMKNPQFNTVGFTSMRFVMGAFNTSLSPPAGFVVPLTASSAMAAFSGGFVAGELTRANVNTWVGNTYSSAIATIVASNPNCNTNGVNLNTGGTNPVLCRFGMGFNNEADCSSCDVYMGMGCTARSAFIQPQCGITNIMTATTPIYYGVRGYLFVR